MPTGLSAPAEGPVFRPGNGGRERGGPSIGAAARDTPGAVRVLFVTPRLPFPPRVGYQLHAVEQLRRLARRHRVTLLAFEAAGAAACEEAREQLGLERALTASDGPLARAAGAMRALLAGEPLQCGIFDTPGFARALAELTREPFDVAHVQLARLAPAVERALPAGLPRVLELIDALSLNMAQRAAREAPPVAWVAAFEARRLARLERALVERWDHLTVVTERDRLAIGEHPRLDVIPNGVDLARFAPSGTPRRSGSVIFTGNLGYFPNVDAVCWLLDEVWPRVLAARPDAALSLVGARPHQRLVRAARRSRRVEVVGPVDDLAARLGEAEVALAPLRAGSGQSLKVLEALATSTPVVATPGAIAGLAVEHDRHLLVAGDARAFAAEVIRLLGDVALRERLARAGRALVEERHGWDAAVTALETAWLAAARGRHPGAAP